MKKGTPATREGVLSSVKLFHSCAFDNFAGGKYPTLKNLLQSLDCGVVSVCIAESAGTR